MQSRSLGPISHAIHHVIDPYVSIFGRAQAADLLAENMYDETSAKVPLNRRQIAASEAPSGQASASSSPNRLLSRLPAFQSAVRGPSASGQIGLQAAAIAMWALALGARFAFDPYLPPGFPYLTFFPAIIITGFVFGIFPALTCAALSAVSAWYWFIPPFNSFVVDGQTVTALIFFLVVVGIDIGLLQLALSAYASQVRAHDDLAKAHELQQVVSQEVDHRIKNLLATVSGLISLSQKHAETPAALAQQLRLRIAAMGNAIIMLRDSLHGGEAEMEAAVTAALEPLGVLSDGRVTVTGPKVVLNSSALMAINLILHELATNAVKYGALSSEGGKIAIEWQRLTGKDGEGILQMDWQEQGGPAVAAPARVGFGTELARRMSASLGGNCDFQFATGGLAVRVTVNADQAIA